MTNVNVTHTLHGRPRATATAEPPGPVGTQDKSDKGGDRGSGGRWDVEAWGGARTWAPLTNGVKHGLMYPLQGLDKVVH